jgi:hypothetical protein
MRDDFDPRAILAELRKHVRRDHPTGAEAKAYLADWWEALHAELGQAYHEQGRGGPNHRLVEEDVRHAREMAAWLRWEAVDAVWIADNRNAADVEAWRQLKATTADKAEQDRLFITLPEAARARLATRTRRPDQVDPKNPNAQPIARPRNYAPLGWPPIRPKVPWSIYLSELLTEKLARAGIVDREPGEDPKEDAAQ